MRYLIVILMIISLGCNRPEKCISFTNSKGNFVLRCCDDGMFRDSANCKCVKEYNQENGTNYQCK